MSQNFTWIRPRQGARQAHDNMLHFFVAFDDF
jgi:hypothetical protein